MERRTFLQALGTGIAAARLPLTAGAGPGEVGRITLLHTNDTHSRIEPFGPGSGDLTGRGGIARRATLVKQLRQAQPGLLLLDAGNTLFGQPAADASQGKAPVDAMNLMGYTAMTLGQADLMAGKTMSA